MGATRAIPAQSLLLLKELLNARKHLHLCARHLPWTPMYALVCLLQSPFLNFGLEGGRVVTLATSEAVQHSPEILKINAVNGDR